MAADEALSLSDKALSLSDFGVFSSGGTVTAPVEGKCNAQKNWQESLASARAFAKAFNEQGGDAQVVSLPDEGIRGNSHFMFEERNSDHVADSLISRLNAKRL